MALYETDILTADGSGCKVDVEPLFARSSTPHLSATDLASLRRITDEIRQRIERFGGQFRDTAPFTLLALHYRVSVHRPDWTGGLRT